MTAPTSNFKRLNYGRAGWRPPKRGPHRPGEWNPNAQRVLEFDSDRRLGRTFDVISRRRLLPFGRVHSVSEGSRELLNENGVFVVQSFT